MENQQQNNSPQNQVNVSVNMGNQTLFTPPEKKRHHLLYLFFGFFFGWLGIHNFYAGHTVFGCLKLALLISTMPFLVPGWWTGLGLFLLIIWVICDLIFISKDGDGNGFK